MPYGFDWDDVNMKKVAAHGLSIEEVELVFFAADLFARLGKNGRTLAFGTVNGRFVCVVFRRSALDAIRVTTAYPISSRRIKR